MSRIYNPPPSISRRETPSSSSNISTSQRAPAGSNFSRGNSVNVSSSGKSSAAMTRQYSATAAVSGVTDPLRLIKVDKNPLSVKAKQTLTLLEQQNEWKKERLKEAAEGVVESTDATDWESSLSKWKDRRRSEPAYQPKVLDLIVDKIELNKVSALPSASSRPDNEEKTSLSNDFRHPGRSTRMSSLRYPYEENNNFDQKLEHEHHQTRTFTPSYSPTDTPRSHPSHPAENDRLRTSFGDRSTTETSLPVKTLVTTSLGNVDSQTNSKSSVEFNLTSSQINLLPAEGLSDNKLVSADECNKLLTLRIEEAKKQNLASDFRSQPMKHQELDHTQTALHRPNEADKTTHDLIKWDDEVPVESDFQNDGNESDGEKIDGLNAVNNDNDSETEAVQQLPRTTKTTPPTSLLLGRQPTIGVVENEMSSSPIGKSRQESSPNLPTNDSPPPLPSVPPPSLPWTMFPSAGTGYDMDASSPLGSPYTSTMSSVTGFPSAMYD